ncbi:MAG: M23 family metallopeptidase [Leptospira sp.]|nr:M23 family metallopeptidase [Leptospira sp.]
MILRNYNPSKFATLPFFLIFFILSTSIQSETIEEKYGSIRDKMAWPLSLYSPISGTFGEYRNYNMHMGADFKTYGMNGHRILATSDGYIDFISQKDKGYGRSFHLNSPDLKIKTKYAHLFSFQGKDGKLELLRQALCMLNGKDEFNINLPSGKFPVKQGEWIALSGETGTGGPHLHLEFRDNYGFINPLFFNAFKGGDEHPPTILKLIWEDSESTETLELKPKEDKPGIYSLEKSIPAKGKIRIKLRGYDFIRSRNRNNVYAFELKEGDKSIYRKEFSYVKYGESGKRYLFYDTNRSSLNPPIYFYNLFDYSKNHSIDLTTYKSGSKLNLTAILEDASGQKSILPIPIIVVDELETKPVKTNLVSGQGKQFFSQDRNLSLDLRRLETVGTGGAVLEPVDWNMEEIKIPEGLTPTSTAYKISTINFNWKGKAIGEIKLNRPPTKKETLYFYDTSIGRFNWTKSWRTKDGFRFQTEKLGIVGVLSDDAPPSVEYVYQIGTTIHLPEASIPGIIERYYYLSDVGSGFTANPEVYLEGEDYPFEYDRDRRGIRILIPKKAFYKKKFLLLQIRPRDRAGNQGKYFTEILTLPEN